MRIALYLLIPISLLLVLACLVVFFYERILLNKKERLEVHPTFSRAWIATYSTISFVLNFPLVLLGPFRTLVSPFEVALHFLIPGIWLLVRRCVWELLFLEITPLFHERWNGRTYYPINLEAREIRVLLCRYFHVPHFSYIAYSSLVTINVHCSLHIDL